MRSIHCVFLFILLTLFSCKKENTEIEIDSLNLRIQVKSGIGNYPISFSLRFFTTETFNSQYYFEMECFQSESEILIDIYDIKYIGDCSSSAISPEDMSNYQCRAIGYFSVDDLSIGDYDITVNLFDQECKGTLIISNEQAKINMCNNLIIPTDSIIDLE